MNVNANIIDSLRAKLTPEDFNEFMRDVRELNNPAAAAFDEWLDTPDAGEFVSRLLKDSDEFGFFTAATVTSVLGDAANSENPLLYYCRAGEDYTAVIGSKGRITEIGASMRGGVRRAESPAGTSASLYNSKAVTEIAMAVTRRLVDAGVCARTPYLSETAGDSPRRCYIVTEEAHRRYGF